MTIEPNPQQKLDEKIAIYRTLIAQNPNSANLLLYLGTALMERNLDAEAIASLQRAVSLDSTCGEGFGRLGHLLVKQYRLFEGIAALKRAVELLPQNSRMPYYLFQALHKAGRLDDAIACLRQSIRLNSDDLETHTALLGTLLYSPEYSREQMFVDRKNLGQRIEALGFQNKSKFPKPASSKRLRIGFVSGDLISHPVGFFLESVLRELHQLNQTDIVLYTRNAVMDSVSERIRAQAHLWVPVFALTDDAFDKRIRSDKIDILLDLSGHTALNRLPVFARKPAPIQVTWLGDCATTGLAAIDYILCDQHGVRDGEEKYYVEKPWRLPNTRLCFTPPLEQVSVAELPALKTGHITFGCFNNLIKMTDKVIAVWARILLRIPSSNLMLKSLSFYDTSICREVAARFAAHGITSDRLLFTPGKSRKEYFADYNLVDIALDPFPFTGGTTSIDGIWMGVPVITLRGNTMGSRQGEGILHNLQLQDWIAADADDYVEIAVRKGEDLSALAKLRGELRARLENSPLCDAKLFAKNLQDAFAQMWQRYCQSASSSSAE